MASLKIPCFGETEFYENRENNSSVSVVIPHADRTAFDAYCEKLTQNGYRKREARSIPAHEYAAFQSEDDAVFLNYFETVGELYVVTEERCNYFAYTDHPGTARLSTTLTQMDLADFGMSYVIRLSDGRFLIIDGGRDFETDREKLYKQLVENTPDGQPVVAAWILTHPHSDHFHLFVSFMETYGDRITVEKILYNFPEHDDLERYPDFTRTDKRFDYNTSALAWVPRMLACIEKSGADVYHPHTGQIYKIGNATCEILVCMDDTMHCTNKVNATSPVLRIELEGQVILFATDASFSFASLPQKYGAYLKADILQIPHHGFQSGTAEG